MYGIKFYNCIWHGCLALWYNLCRFIPEPALELMDMMLALDPSKRISAEESLKHPFLDINPAEIIPPE